MTTTSLEEPHLNLLRLCYEPKLRDIARALMDPPRGITQIRGRLCSYNGYKKVDKSRVSAVGLLKYHYKYAYYDCERYKWVIYCSVDVCNYHTAPFNKPGNYWIYFTPERRPPHEFLWDRRVSAETTWLIANYRRLNSVVVDLSFETT